MLLPSRGSLGPFHCAINCIYLIAKLEMYIVQFPPKKIQQKKSMQNMKLNELNIHNGQYGLNGQH